MRSLLKSGLLARMITIAINSNGQTFGIKGGLNLSDTRYSPDEENLPG
jgi:hypothetical protein